MSFSSSDQAVRSRLRSIMLLHNRGDPGQCAARFCRQAGSLTLTAISSDLHTTYRRNRFPGGHALNLWPGALRSNIEDGERSLLRERECLMLKDPHSFACSQGRNDRPKEAVQAQCIGGERQRIGHTAPDAARVKMTVYAPSSFIDP